MASIFASLVAGCSAAEAPCSACDITTAQGSGKDGRRSFNRTWSSIMGQNVEEGQLTATIEGFETSQENSDFLLHIDYAIRVTYESPCGVVDSHTTSRRFRDFVELDCSLRGSGFTKVLKNAGVRLPTRYVLNKLSSKTIESRLSLLNVYIQAVVANIQAEICVPLQEFLGIDTSIFVTKKSMETSASPVITVPFQGKGDAAILVRDTDNDDADAGGTGTTELDDLDALNLVNDGPVQSPVDALSCDLDDMDAVIETVGSSSNPEAVKALPKPSSQLITGEEHGVPLEDDDGTDTVEIEPTPNSSNVGNIFLEAVRAQEVEQKQKRKSAELMKTNTIACVEQAPPSFVPPPVSVKRPEVFKTDSLRQQLAKSKNTFEKKYSTLQMIKSRTLTMSNFKTLKHPLQLLGSLSNRGYSKKKKMDKLANITPEGSSFKKQYKLMEEVGRGAFSVVRFGTSMKDNTPVAIKCLTVKKKDEAQIAKIREEALIMIKSETQFGVQFIDLFLEKDTAYMVLEWCPGGDLRDLICERDYLSESESWWILNQALAALLHLHSLRIVHRDIKLDNILIGDTDHASGILMAPVKICDFGIACELPATHEGEKSTEADALLTDGCGTLCYAAPEVISSKKKYGCRADIWSCGVVAYALLSGEPPFESDNKKELRRLIKAGKYDMTSEVWAEISDDAKDFIGQMLTVEQDQRWSAAKVLKHEWFESISDDFELSQERD